jgi:hypothetical protein
LRERESSGQEKARDTILTLTRWAVHQREFPIAATEQTVKADSPALRRLHQPIGAPDPDVDCVPGQSPPGFNRDEPGDGDGWRLAAVAQHGG